MVIHFFIRDGCVNCHHTDIIYHQVKDKYRNDLSVGVLLHLESKEKDTSFWMHDIKIVPAVVVSNNGKKDDKKYIGIHQIFKAHEEGLL